MRRSAARCASQRATSAVTSAAAKVSSTCSLFFAWPIRCLDAMRSFIVRYVWHTSREANTVHSLSPPGLRDSWIFESEYIALQNCSEPIPSCSHGLWPGGFVVAVPTAEASGDPGHKGKTAWCMRIFLPIGVALQFFREALKSDGELIINHIASGAWTSISGVHELNDAERSDECHGGEIEHALSVADLAILKIKTVAFERTEGLLDAPAQSIELNHFIRIREAGYLVSRIQAPMDARLAFWRIHLARFHQCELHRFRKLVQPIVGRASDAPLARTQLDCGSTFLFAGTARCHTDNARSQRFAAREGLEQRSSRTQIAIMGSADNQFDRLRATREQREHIAFP